MLQLIGLLAISWLLVWLFSKKNLSVLGGQPTKERLFYFIILFIVSSLISATTFLLKMYFAKEEYTLNQSLTTEIFFTEIGKQIRTVLTEELVCRGVLLYLLIKKIGQTKALFFSSLFFAALHWLNSEIWGNGMQMILVFIFTFTMGFLLAYSYARTYSILMPFAIHLGWNLTQNFIFPDKATTISIFILASPPPTVTISYLAFFTMLLLPKIAVLLISYEIIKKQQQVRIP